MSDTVKSWIEERRVRRNVLGHQGLIFVPDEYGNATLWHDGGRVGSRDEGVRSLADAHTNLPRALDALEAVIELHQPEAFEDAYSMQSGFMCESCYDPDKNEWVEWPCATVQAIEGALKR